jgi:hypothetical protein
MQHDENIKNKGDVINNKEPSTAGGAKGGKNISVANLGC